MVDDMVRGIILKGLHKETRGSAAIELACVIPTIVIFLIVLSQFFALMVRAEQNLVAAEATVSREVLLREALPTSLRLHPCLEELQGEGRRVVDRGPVRVLTRDIHVPQEVTFVVDPICRY